VKTLLLALFVVAMPLSSMNWKADLIASTNALKAGEYEKALKIDDRVIDEMWGLLGAGDAEMPSFALVLSHKALALAGLGRNEDALWYWHEALSFHPGYATADLSPFGAPGAFLSAHPIEPINAPKFGTKSGVEAPEVVKRVEPMYPEGARRQRVFGIVIIESLIDHEGVIRDARVLRAPAPALAHSALESVRKWHFKPAMRNGQPVDVIFNLTINFRLH